MSEPPEMLTCSRCGEMRPASEFFRRRDRARGFSSECKRCHKGAIYDIEKSRERRMRREYGITPAEYDVLHKLQVGRCALCGGESNGRGRLAVDHDHDTGQVRGLLCFTCNTMLGRVEALSLSAIATYLGEDLSRDETMARLDELLALERAA